VRGKLVMGLVLAVGVLIVSGPLFAHHGNAAYDFSKRLTMKGTVTAWLWSNPHCLLRFDVKGDNGEAVHWVGEIGAPVSVIDGGWRASTFKTGDEVTVTLEPMKNGRPAGQITEVVLPDGSTLHAGLSTRIPK
jgi:hypothetical protein